VIAKGVGALVVAACWGIAGLGLVGLLILGLVVFMVDNGGHAEQQSTAPAASAGLSGPLPADT
jgi:hypothetical protein